MFSRGMNSLNVESERNDQRDLQDWCSPISSERGTCCERDKEEHVSNMVLCQAFIQQEYSIVFSVSFSLDNIVDECAYDRCSDSGQ